MLDCACRLPHPPEEAVLLGSVRPMLRKDHHRALRAWSQQLGPVYAARIGWRHVRRTPGLASACCAAALHAQAPACVAFIGLQHMQKCRVDADEQLIVETAPLNKMRLLANNVHALLNRLVLQAPSNSATVLC